jgi:ketosteroid isomerase-like protein
MSQENVELYRRATQASNDGDLDAFLALMDADVEAVPRLAPMEGGYHGHDGVRRWWDSLREAFPDFRTEVVEVRDLGDLTLAELRNRGRGAGSDTPVEQRSWHVAEWRDKKVVWWRAYGTEAEALEAVGLSEQDAHADS